MNNTISKSPSALLYDELCKSANSNRRENAQNIKVTCDHMEKDGVEILLNGVARRCLESFGRPAISTVTNTGSKLGEYVRLRKQDQCIDKGSIIEKTGVSAKIQDPVLSQEVKILEEMVKGLRNENNALRVTFKKLDVDIDNGIRQILTIDKNTDVDSNKQLASPTYPSNLKGAVTSLLNHLSDRGYSMYRGRFGINKKTVLTGAEIDALKEVTSMSESEFNARYSSDK
jgi:hypothetical protein